MSGRKASDWVSSGGYCLKPRRSVIGGGGKTSADKKREGKERSKGLRRARAEKTSSKTRLVSKPRATNGKRSSSHTPGRRYIVSEVQSNPYNYVRHEDGSYEAIAVNVMDGREHQREGEDFLMATEEEVRRSAEAEERRKEGEKEKERREALWNAKAKEIAQRLASLCRQENTADNGFLEALREELLHIGEAEGKHLVSILPYRLVCDVDEKVKKDAEHASWWKAYLCTDVMWSSLLRLQNKEMRHWLLQEESLAVVREDAETGGDIPSSAISVFSGADGAFHPNFTRKSLSWNALLHPHLIPPQKVLIDCENAGTDVLLPSGATVRPSVVPFFSHFQRNFDVFTCGFLKGVDLSQAFVSGSSLTACLQPDPPHIEALHRRIDDTRQAIAEMPLPPELSDNIFKRVLHTSLLPELETEIIKEQEKLYRTSDVDIFVAAENCEEGLSVVKRIITQITENLYDQCLPYFLLRTSNAVTICPGAPYRNIQVVLMMVASVDEALSFSDLDCTAFAYDGGQVLAVPRSMRAMNYRCNIVSPSASQRLGGPSRINKYIQRGFCALMFELCYHYPRCDVEPSEDVMSEFTDIERKRPAPYAEFLIYGDIVKMLDHLEGLQKDWLPDVPPFVVGDCLGAIGMDDHHWTGDLEETRKVDRTLEQIHLPPVRWKRTELLLRNINHHLLPKCYQCARRNGSILEMEAGKRRTMIPLCNDCRAFNAEKRAQEADLKGMVALVTGGRIKIGFETALRLLNSGALVIVTTRFPHDAAARFAAQEGFPEWRNRLHIYGVDFRNVPSVQLFVAHVQSHYEHMEVLVNNAAQTVRRPPGYYRALVERERELDRQSREGVLPDLMRDLVKEVSLNPHVEPQLGRLGGERETERDIAIVESRLCVDSAENALSCLIPSDRYSPAEELALFPPGETDEHGLQLDLRSKTSWNSTIEEVSVVEMAEVQMVNAVVPFILTQQLLPLLRREPTSKSGFAFIINVTSTEGQFSGNKYGGRHPHTNMAKASLNMLTRSIASQYRGMGIIVNSVDTGWISEMQPAGGRSETAAVAPLGVADGAARVLDPVYRVLNGHTAPWGVLLKNYIETAW